MLLFCMMYGLFTKKEVRVRAKEMRRMNRKKES